MQDARFQQLFEQYQDTVLRAARELEDAAIGFAQRRAQVAILEESVQAARRSLDIADVQYREGLVDFQRVLDSQRALFSQQERLVTTRGGVAQSLIALYKAMGGGWQPGRSMPIVDDETRAEMADRSNWKRLLDAPLPAARRFPTASVDGHAMNQDADSTPAPPADPAAGSGSRKGAAIVAALILISLGLYLVGDRLTPSTSQARIQAFVVPVAAEVAGKVVKVHIRDNDEVQPGQPLFDIDPVPYEIALQSAQAAYAPRARHRRSVPRRRRGRARRAEGGRGQSRDGRERRRPPGTPVPRRSRRDLGAPPRDRAGHARGSAQQGSRSRGRAAHGARGGRRDRRSERAGPGRPRGPRQGRSSTSPTPTCVAPARGTVTDLRTDVGHFVQAGAPVMTLVADHDLWISADMTENNLGHIDVGDEAAIVLDVLPGQVLKGRVRSIGRGVDSGQQSQSGSLPTVQNDRDWLRQAQRIPVSIEFDADEDPRLDGRARRRPGRGPRLRRRQPADEPPRRDLHPRLELAVLPLLRSES